MGLKAPTIITPPTPAQRPERYSAENAAPNISFEQEDSQGTRQLFRPKAKGVTNAS